VNALQIFPRGRLGRDVLGDGKENLQPHLRLGVILRRDVKTNVLFVDQGFDGAALQIRPVPATSLRA
jgi:hypothetical protein